MRPRRGRKKSFGTAVISGQMINFGANIVFAPLVKNESPELVRLIDVRSGSTISLKEARLALRLHKAGKLSHFLRVVTFNTIFLANHPYCTEEYVDELYQTAMSIVKYYLPHVREEISCPMDLKYWAGRARIEGIIT